MKDAQKGVRMTDDEENGLIEFKPAPSHQVLRPTDAALTNVDRLAESIAREMGYSGAAYALEVVSIQDWVYAQAKLGELRLYREDKPFPFVVDALFEFHGGLRLSSLDVQKVRVQFVGEPNVEPQRGPVSADRQVPPPHFPNWSLKKPKRYPGYRKPLNDLLKLTHASGQSCPTARDVLDAWRQKPPPEVCEVMADGLKYYDGPGNVRAATLKAITQAINGLVHRTNTDE